MRRSHTSPFFFFNDTATTEIYTLSLHDALPISNLKGLSTMMAVIRDPEVDQPRVPPLKTLPERSGVRSEEHPPEIASHSDVVCRLLIDEKKNITVVRDSDKYLLLRYSHLAWSTA